ncbi:MAG: efflux RND transporter periplasmic adaptor subunit [Bernardetiaceae bacterium]|nr:efflux RND transporter periplasmic adaptor subunit [Bernardetiaceae bacterium]
MALQNKILLFFAFLALGLTACEEQKKEQKKLATSKTIAVKTYTLKQSEGAVTIFGTGILTTENEVRYAFKIGGIIDRIYVNEGESFKKGKLLATLKIAEIEAGFIQAKLGLEKSERDLTRITNLYKDSVATLEQLQNTKTAYEVAKKQLEAITFNKEYAYIYAANNGFVTKKLANEGEVIDAGMPALAINVNDNDSWILKVGLSDKDWAIINLDDRATVSLDAYPNHEISGEVYRKLQAADQNSGSFQVEIKLKTGNLKPALGMFGKATIQTDIIQKYQSIPYDALVEADGTSAFVFVPIEGGKVRRQAVEIAHFDNSAVQIKSGLEGIDEIVLTNSAFLNEKSSITIIK